MTTSTDRVLSDIREVADPSRLTGMARVGINVTRALGVSIPQCRTLARRHRNEHELAMGLWASEIHEARIIASMVDDPGIVERDQMESWVLDFDSWDLCDQVCGNLFDRIPIAEGATRDWVERDEEFVKRAGFVLIAERAHRDRDSPNEVWLTWLPVIRQGTRDERNYVRKAVSWALREIGKRSETLRLSVIEEAELLMASDDRNARWIGREALRELRSEAVITRSRNETTG